MSRYLCLIGVVLWPTLNCLAWQVEASSTNAHFWSTTLREAANLNVRGEYQQAIDKYQSLLAKAEPEGELYVPLQVRSYAVSQIADAEISLGRYAEAEANVQHALDALSHGEQAQTATYAVTAGVLADVLRVRGDYERAMEVAEEAVTVGKKTLPPSSVPYGILALTSQCCT